MSFHSLGPQPSASAYSATRTRDGRAAVSIGRFIGGVNRFERSSRGLEGGEQLFYTPQNERMFTKERIVELQPKQQQILQVIEEAVRTQGYPPTVREIGAAVGLSSPASVQGHLGALESLGYIRRGSSKRRALEVIRRPGDGGAAGVRGSQSVCLLGRVAAGLPILAEENIEEYLDLPSFLVSGGDCFALRIAGTSMVNAGILDGDVVVVRQQQSADDGDIVVAMLQDEATVKRFFRESDRVRLQPENEAMEPIYARDPLILGKVTGVLRRL